MQRPNNPLYPLYITDKCIFSKVHSKVSENPVCQQENLIACFDMIFLVVCDFEKAKKKKESEIEKVLRSRNAKCSENDIHGIIPIFVGMSQRYT